MNAKIRGSQVGLSAANDLLVRDPVTGLNHYVPRGATVRFIVQMTQAAYDALDPPDDNTLYIIVG